MTSLSLVQTWIVVFEAYLYDLFDYNNGQNDVNPQGKILASLLIVAKRRMLISHIAPK